MIQVIKYQIKFMLRPSLFIGTLYALLLPFFISFKELDEAEFVLISEPLFIVMGAVILPSIMNIERDCDSEDTVVQMPYKYPHVFLIRYLLSLSVMSVLCGYLLLSAKLLGAEFSFFKLLIVNIGNNMYIGTIGLIIMSLFNNISIGYMIPFSYLYFEYSTHGLYTKDLFLFGLIRGNLISKYYLFAITAFLVLLQYVYIRRKY